MTGVSSPEEHHTSLPKGKKILIIDDSLTVVKSLAKILRRAKLKPIECTDAEKALSLAKEKNPDLILLDLVMPKMDGLEILKQLRALARFHSVPVVMLTATKDEEKVIAALEAGADDYVTKPFQKAILLARISTHLRSWQLFVDLEKANRNLLAAQQQEVEAERWKAAVEMAGATAHKLNQPLTSIVCYADLLLKKFSAENEARRAIKRITLESDRMATILRKMAELTKIHTSQYVGDVTIIDLDRSFEKTDPGIRKKKR